MFRWDGTLGRAMTARVPAAIRQNLIVDFVPKSDSQVRRLLTTREDIFPDYTLPGFEQAFDRYFETREKVLIPGTERTLYRMTRREP